MTEERLQRLFNGSAAGLTVCVGSWKAYNECNEHALGSCLKTSDGKIRFYIDFMELDGAEELREVLYAIGWSDAEMEETFVQDYQSGWAEIDDCDHQNAFDLADFIRDHRDEIEEAGTAKLKALMKCEYTDFREAVEEADNWDFREGMDASDYAYEIANDCYGIDRIMGDLACYFDYDAFGRDMRLNGEITQTKNGLLIRY